MVECDNKEGTRLNVISFIVTSTSAERKQYSEMYLISNKYQIHVI